MDKQFNVSPEWWISGQHGVISTNGMNFRFFASIVLGTVLFSPASAAVVKVLVSGTVTSTTIGQFYAPTPFVAGDPWEVEYSYSTPTPATAVNLEGPEFLGISSSFRINISGHEWVGNPTMNVFTFTTSGFQEANFNWSATGTGALAVDTAGFTLTFGGRAQSGTDFLIVPDYLPMSPQDWQLNVPTIKIFGGGGNQAAWTMGGTANSITLSTVPEPGAASLVGSGLLFWLSIRRSGALKSVKSTGWQSAVGSADKAETGRRRRHQGSEAKESELGKAVATRIQSNRSPRGGGRLF